MGTTNDLQYKKKNILCKKKSPVKNPTLKKYISKSVGFF